MITISTLCWFEESPENFTGGIVDGPDQTSSANFWDTIRRDGAPAENRTRT